MLKVLSTCAALFLFVPSAMAQSGACAADIKKTCANIEPGGGRIATCLKENLTNLSDVCKTRLAEVAARARACRADVKKQCSSAKRRVQKVVCIKDALANLGNDCKAATASVVAAKR